MVALRFFLLVFFSLLSFLSFGQAFVTTWQTDSPGPSDDNQITIPTRSGETYNYDVDWGDGTSDTGVTGNITHTYPSPGTYTVSITGLFPRIYFDGGGFFSTNSDHDKILTVQQWGSNPWTSMAQAFSGCRNLRITASDAPDLSGVTDLSQMFFEAESMNDNISSWDVSTITNMFEMFRSAEAFNQPLDSWNVSNVESMEAMFRQADSFNQSLNSWNVLNVTTMRDMFFIAENFNGNISSWDVDNVENMIAMFSGTPFNQDISGWNVGNVTSMFSMFSGAEQFNQDISGWDIGSVTDMSFMFSDASAFNADISVWDVSLVTSMDGMFRRATAFTADITGWNVSLVTDFSEMFAENTTFNQNIGGWVVSSAIRMTSMFSGASSFNQDISGWNVSSVRDMRSMFANAVAFNQDISGWNVGMVDDMRGMFGGATSFNQNLGGWDIGVLDEAFGMFNNSGLSIENYDNLLIGWSAQTVQTGVSFGGSGIFYCAGSSAREELIANSGWNITDGGQGCITLYDGSDTTAPQIDNVAPEPVDYGSIDAASSKSRFFTLRNELATPITGLSAIVTNNTGTAFTIPIALNPDVDAAGEETFEVQLGPFSTGTYAETVTLISDQFSGFTFNVSGEITTSPAPEIKVFSGNSIFNTEIVSGDDFNLGDELRGTNVTREITIQNLGSEILDISAFNFSGSVFSQGGSPSLSIPINGTETISLILDGSVGGNFQETLLIENNDPNENPFEIILEGEIEGPEIAVFDADAIFAGPQIFDDQTSPVQLGTGALGSDIIRPITVTNFNGLDLEVSDIVSNNSNFSVDLTSFTVAAEIDGILSSVTFNIILDGSVAGVQNGSITIVNDDDTDNEANFTFPIEGTISSSLPEIAVFTGGGADVFDGQTTPVDFGSQVQGSGINETFSIQNQGTVDLIISSINLSSGPYIINSALSFPITITSGNSQLLDIFLPGTNVGVFNSSITIESNDTDEATFNFPITGEITAPPVPDIAVFAGPDTSSPEIINQTPPNVYDFGSTPQGIDITRQVTIENQGSADLEIDFFIISNPRFFISSTPGGTLTPGDTETIDINFDASSQGIETSLFTLENNDPDEAMFILEFRAEVTGPPEPEITVYEGGSTSGSQIFNGQIFNFGSDEQGNDIVRTITIENEGTANLIISNINVTGTGYTLLSAFPSSLSPGGTVSLDIELSGATIGVFPGNVVINSDDGDEATFNIPVTGTITAPNNEPTITTISDITINEDEPSNDIPFTIGDIETNVNDLTITVNSSNTALVPLTGIILGGTGADRTVSITPEPHVSGTAIITISVDDGTDVTTESFTVTVVAINDAPLVTGQDELSTPINTAIALELDDFQVEDVDNDFPTGFTLEVLDGSNYTFAGNTITPNLDFTGDLSVPIVVNDGADDSPIFNVSISVIEGEISVEIGGEPLASGDNINFDDIPVGAEDSRELIITNSGTSTLEITEIIIDGDDFRLSGRLPDPIAPRNNAAISIIFQPSSVGEKTAVLTVRSASAADFEILLRASGLSEIPAIEIFNVVTTQQNGKHDFLEIRNIEFYESNRVYIYSRWGNEVYKTENYNNTDNRFIGNSDGGDELPDGTYYYVIELNGGETVENGFFLLRR